MLLTIREPAMLELTLLGTVFVLTGLLLWLVVDSDDDDRSGGLRQPVLVPVRATNQRRY